MPLQCESLEADPHCLLSDQFTIKSLTQPLTVRKYQNRETRNKQRVQTVTTKTNVTAEVLQQIFKVSVQESPATLDVCACAERGINQSIAVSSNGLCQLVIKVKIYSNNSVACNKYY